MTAKTLQFTGKERDGESGLDYFGARYFSGDQGRFTSPDWSTAPQPVPYADLSNPQTLNLYGYVRNNPLRRRDLDGHDGDDDKAKASSTSAGRTTTIVHADGTVEKRTGNIAYRDNNPGDPPVRVNNFETVRNEVY